MGERQEFEMMMAGDEYMGVLAGGDGGVGRLGEGYRDRAFILQRDESMVKDEKLTGISRFSFIMGDNGIQ